MLWDRFDKSKCIHVLIKKLQDHLEWSVFSNADAIIYLPQGFVELFQAIQGTSTLLGHKYLEIKP